MANMPAPGPVGPQNGKPMPSNTPVPPAEPKKGSTIGKLVKLVVVLAAAGFFGTTWWHGKRLGEEQKLDGVKWFWTWNTQEWEGWYGKVQSAADKAGNALAEKTKAAQTKLEAWRAERAKTASTPPTNGTPTTPTTPDGTKTPDTTATTPTTPTPATPADGALPENWKEIAELVNAGGEAWEKHDYATAKTKLSEAKAKIDPLMAKTPVHPEVQKAHDLARDLLEDISMR